MPRASGQSRAMRGQQQGRHGLIEKEVVVDKLLLLSASVMLLSA